MFLLFGCCQVYIFLINVCIRKTVKVLNCSICILLYVLRYLSILSRICLRRQDLILWLIHFRRFPNIANFGSSPSLGTLFEVRVFPNLIKQTFIRTADWKTDRVPCHGCRWIFSWNGRCLYGISGRWKTHVRNNITINSRGWSYHFTPSLASNIETSITNYRDDCFTWFSVYNVGIVFKHSFLWIHTLQQTKWTTSNTLHEIKCFVCSFKRHF